MKLAASHVRPGLSPLTRGSRTRGGGEQARRGSIPAHTGKPCADCEWALCFGVYPRSHGEATPSQADIAFIKSLSPLTRGSHRRMHRGLGGHGSIPAHTGKPCRGPPVGDVDRVYPRSHGEALEGALAILPVMGLSPLTRGSHTPEGGHHASTGSIPAHTGKPFLLAATSILDGVYPRSHGEAVEAEKIADRRGGLSPLTRGSPTLYRSLADSLGSIPAHTGKPLSASIMIRLIPVYPRSHGEAGQTSVSARFSPGLSPLTRGSHDPAGVLCVAEGSIPAHTGKPSFTRPTMANTAVYPRSHGEARFHRLDGRADGGLSPLTRGSPPESALPGLCHGSIPAHTGKPDFIDLTGEPTEVYPRSHGEARQNPLFQGYVMGLSPLTRGSLSPGVYREIAPGSIPAHTGKPTS